MPKTEASFRRRYPRRKFSIPCHLEWGARQLLGRTSDVSYEGVTILLRAPIELTTGEVTAIFIAQQEEEIVLRARPIHAHPWKDFSRVGFKVVQVERGEQTWHQLCYVPSW